jgi:hypothetical protein
VGLFGILSVAGYVAGKNDRTEQGMDASMDFPVGRRDRDISRELENSKTMTIEADRLG